ncbi:hypothetical protein [Butyrivibrio sp. AC2005]|nr:hypothetical protein [Butyrivibrio sp. AC2005]
MKKEGAICKADLRCEDRIAADQREGAIHMDPFEIGIMLEDNKENVEKDL